MPVGRFGRRLSLSTAAIMSTLNKSCIAQTVLEPKSVPCGHVPRGPSKILWSIRMLPRHTPIMWTIYAFATEAAPAMGTAWLAGASSCLQRLVTALRSDVESLASGLLSSGLAAVL